MVWKVFFCIKIRCFNFGFIYLFLVDFLFNYGGNFVLEVNFFKFFIIFEERYLFVLRYIFIKGNKKRGMEFFEF